MDPTDDLERVSELPITTDVVLFTIRGKVLAVLLVREGTDGEKRWRLPGGRVAQAEPLDAAAHRHLETETDVKGVYLEQLYTFGNPRRTPTKRLVSVAYYALVPMPSLPATGGVVAREATWFAISQLPELALDHGEIVTLAHRRLAAKLDYSTIALQFMPERFTLRALQQVYEAILMERLDKRNFRKRILGIGCLQETGGFDRPGPHRPARLYRIKEPGAVRFIR